MSGGSLYDLKTVLGHSDIKTTERYAHLSNEHLAGVKNIIKPRIENYGDVIEVTKLMTQDRSRLIHASMENGQPANL